MVGVTKASQGLKIGNDHVPSMFDSWELGTLKPSPKWVVISEATTVLEGPPKRALELPEISVVLLSMANSG